MSTESDLITVVTASDSSLVGDGLAALLAGVPEIDVVGRSDSLADLPCMTERLKPHVVIVTVRAQVAGSTHVVETARRLKALYPEMGIVVIADRPGGFALDLFRGGSSGIAFLIDDRNASIGSVLEALRGVKTGHSVLDPGLVDTFIRRGDGLGMHDLTPREIDILEQMAHGKSNRAIAEALYVSTKSIEKGITSIFAKLGPFEPGADRRVNAALIFLRAETDPFGPVPSRDARERLCRVRNEAPETPEQRTSEIQFRLLVDGVVDYAIFGLDVHGLVTTWNTGAERIKGYRSDEIIGRHFSVFYPPADIAAGIPGAELAAAATDGSFETEGWRVRKDGSQFWATVVITSLFNDDGCLTGFAKVSRDVTERRNTDRALRESERQKRDAEFESRLAAMVEFSDDAIWSCSRDGTVATWNGGAERLYGYSAEEMVGCNVLRPGADGLLAGGWLPPGVDDELSDVFSRIGRGERVGHFDSQRIRGDACVVQVSVTVSPIHGADGELTGFSVVARDITERKVQERVLAEEQRRLRSAEVIGHIGSWEMDLDTHLVTWSDTLFRLYGVEPGDGVAPRQQNLANVHADDAEGLQLALDECEHSGTAIVARYRSVRPSDGELRWFEVRGERIIGDVGGPRLTGSVIDISEQVWARQVLESARDDAMAASRQKSSFLANVSHEIRTPMNGVIGMTGLLSDTTLDINQRDFVDTIRGSGEALLTVINDVLDFSKIESGELDLECHPFDLRECMEATLAVAAANNTRGIELLGHFDDGCPPWVLGDVTRFRQVLVNLVGNAVKFTEDGQVLLTIEPAGDRLFGDRLRISVCDTGIGIPADRLETLFDPYSQVDPSTTRLHGGTGLGLAISNRLVRAMDGALDVESVLGEGSTFSFSIDLTAAPAPAASSVSLLGMRLKGLHALVVDDNPTNRRVVRYQLEAWGMRVTDVASGSEALGLVKSDEHFDVALVDMKMPNMTGEELAVHFSLIDVGRTIPLVLVSACRWQLTQSSLFSAVLTKPVMNDRLLKSLIEAIWPGESTGAPGEASEWSNHCRLMRVLLVEDNPVNQRVGRLILEKWGHRVDVAGNGLEAVRAANLVPYDTVFMDIQMPEMDGFDATRLIRAGTPPFSQPYIIALTANATIEDQRRCLDAGMDEFLTKPVRNDHFRAALERASQRLHRPALL